jgi:probable rRNA maturation factor
MEVVVLRKSDLWDEIVSDNELSNIVLKFVQKLGLNSKFSDATLSIVIADDEFVKNLNYKFRGKDSATNVLSFPGVYNDDQLDPFGDEINVGDIVFGFETIRNEALQQNKLLKNHFTHLLLHGFLHLLGYTHDSDVDANEMESLEAVILTSFDIENPYISSN